MFPWPSLNCRARFRTLLSLIELGPCIHIINLWRLMSTAKKFFAVKNVSLQWLYFAVGGRFNISLNKFMSHSKAHSHRLATEMQLIMSHRCNTIVDKPQRKVTQALVVVSDRITIVNRQIYLNFRNNPRSIGINWYRVLWKTGIKVILEERG